MQETEETWVQSLIREDPLEEGMATHSDILAWRIPIDRGAWQAVAWGCKDRGARPWGCKESDMTEQLSTAQSIFNFSICVIHLSSLFALSLFLLCPW